MPLESNEVVEQSFSLKMRLNVSLKRRYMSNTAASEKFKIEGRNNYSPRNS